MRPASTFRAARRNQVLRVEKRVWRGIRAIRIEHPPVRLNFSQNWASAGPNYHLITPPRAA